MTARLRVDRLTTGYVHAPVLRDLSLEVGDEIVAVFGSNGAGKTTLLRAISGSLPAWRGEVLLEGAPLRRTPSWRRVTRGLAHVPEGRHVFAAMSVEENLDVAGLAVRRQPSARHDVYELFPRLHERRAQAAGTLSGGEQQMLAIGRALMTRPRLLLVDELSAGLAPVVAQSLVAGLAEIRSRGIALLLVEQSPQLVADLVDRAYVLDHGTLVAEGTIAQIGGVERLAEMYLARR
ncbi:MAG TPA: ABC transporter ATP-binding protein [Acidimicrobiia bacterium]